MTKMVLSTKDSTFFIMGKKLEENLAKLKELIAEKEKYGFNHRIYEIRSELLEDNFPLILDRLKRINPTRTLTDDDIQNGRLGLLETIDKFDPDKASSLGALGHYRILHNCDLYKDHTGGIRIPKSQVKDYKFYVKNLIEDRYLSEQESATKLERILAEAVNILEPDLELPIFSLKISSRITYKELTKMFGLSRTELGKIYNKARDKVIAHCKEVFVDAVNE